MSITAAIGLKEKFLTKRQQLIGTARELYAKSGSWKNVEQFLRNECRDELSFLKPNMFTYFLFTGSIFLPPFLYLWKVSFVPGTTAYFFSRLAFTIAAAIALKGLIGHFVVIFLNHDKFETELKNLKASVEGGKNGRQFN